jgi:hypothetical protein
MWGYKFARINVAGTHERWFSKVDGQFNIFEGNGQTGQEHISKDEPIRHL